MRRASDGIQSGRAQAIDGEAGHMRRQSGEQQRHPRDIAIVFSGLIRAAVNHIVEQIPLHPGVAGHERSNRNGGQIVRADGGEAAAIAPKRRSNRVANVSCFHARLSPEPILYFTALERTY